MKHFESEDKAFCFYLELAQENCPFDLTEDDVWYESVVDGFWDWADTQEITWDE